MAGGAYLGRRPVLALLAGSLLGGCGFRPIYQPTASGAAAPAAEGLAEIDIALIPERQGQLLREALQERFERNGLAVSRRYDLSVSFSVSNDAIGIQQDSSNTRQRLVGIATYRLTAQDPSRSTLVSGSARSLDGLNVFDNELFAAQLETESVTRRIAEAVADSIALQLAAYFTKQAALAAR